MKFFGLLGLAALGAVAAQDGPGNIDVDPIITDPPDASTTMAGGGPGGGGPGGGGGGPGGGGGTPPPPYTGEPVEPPRPTDPPLVPTEPKLTIGTVPVETPPPIVTGLTGNNDVETAVTGTGGRADVTYGQTEPYVPPSVTVPKDKDTTQPFVSTSHKTHYDCKKECGKDEHQGDGFCDDYNNFCGCDWDGGDCCGTENHYIYCTHCRCRDPLFALYFDCPGECAEEDYQGDGYCDDDNNVCACNWDGGDCCGDFNHYGFCDECQCKDISYEGHDPDCNGNCGTATYVGDGFCDDDNNNCGCDWDNGDCCGNTNSYAHCDDCFCLDPENSYHLAPNNTVGICITPCFSQGFAADGFCDDANNVCGCDWDGGDCCGMQNSFLYCDDCLCLDPLYNIPCPDETATCENQDWYGDAYCDDGNNICGCSWDGGDCCGAEHFYNYCDACECKDPAYIGEVICSGKCTVKAWSGDGYCDDDNNNCGCDWDGGDCCDPNAKTTHCTDCLCLDPEGAPEECNTPCGASQWSGDGFCDDENNHCGCDWDSGDCCGASGEATQYAYCKDCLCLNLESPDYVEIDETCSGQCYHNSWKGDTFCDDQNNNCGCDWDGGDCCGSANHYQHCTKCACLDPDQDSSYCTTSCQHTNWAGDGFCDDSNNVCGCDWDGGDCCGDDKTYTQCTECKCQDPAIVSFTTQVGGGKDPIVTGPPVTFEQVTDEFDPPPTPPAGGGGGITPPADAN